MTAKRSIGARVVRFAAALVLMLAVVELGLRATVADWAWIDQFEFDRADPPCFGMRPNTEGWYEGWWRRVTPTRVRINSAGLRDREYPPAPRPGTVRALALGDSHVFGLGTELEVGIPRRLEGLLAQRLGRPAEVVNGGVPGYDLPKEIAALPRLLDLYRPSLVIFFLDPDDLDDVACAHWKRRVRPLLRLSYTARAFYVTLFPNSPPQKPRESRVAELGRQLDRLAELRAGDQDRWRVVFGEIFPLGGYRSTIEERGYRVIQTGELFQRLRSEPEKYVVVGEGHLNARGIEVFAAAVAEGLAAAGALDGL